MLRLPLFIHVCMRDGNACFSDFTLCYALQDVQLIGSGQVEYGHRKTIAMSQLEVRLRDNRRHVISRTFEALGYEVLRFSRKSFGPVLLGSLKRGDSRPLIAKEIKALKRGVSGKTIERTQ